MKNILIENKVYTVSNEDFKKVEEEFNKGLSSIDYDVNSDILGYIEDKYKPKIVLDGMFNYC